MKLDEERERERERQRETEGEGEGLCERKANQRKRVSTSPRIRSIGARVSACIFMCSGIHFTQLERAAVLIGFITWSVERSNLCSNSSSMRYYGGSGGGTFYKRVGYEYSLLGGIKGGTRLSCHTFNSDFIHTRIIRNT